MNKPTIGIVGYGSFGAFLARQLAAVANLVIYDPAIPEYASRDLLGQIARVDFIVLAVPLAAYDEVLTGIKPNLRPETVIIDICSVKVRPIEAIRVHLPSQPIVATHPLFGPESAADSVAGHVLVMCPDQSNAASYHTVRSFAESRELRIVELDAAAHDKEIAVVQGLTFFVARALKEMDIHSQALLTPSFARLLHLAELERHHSDQLFKTIQTGNPFTAEVRQQFIRRIGELDDSIRESPPYTELPKKGVVASLGNQDKYVSRRW